MGNYLVENPGRHHLNQVIKIIRYMETMYPQ